MSVDNVEVYGNLLKNLSKVLDCVNHELLKATFHDYNLDCPYLKLIQSYSDHRKKKLHFNNSFSFLLEIGNRVYSVPF